MSDFHEVLVIDSEEEKLFPVEPRNPKILERIKGLSFERLRLKSKYFTKEYDSKFNLLSVDPFFIDVRISVIPPKAKFVEEYEIKKTGAKVRIYLDEKGTDYVYTVKIPEMQIKVSDVIRIHDSVEWFKKTGEVYDEIVKRWYLDYGILEHLLFDDQILEININPPAYKTSMRIVHAKYQECTSNIYASEDFLNYILTRLKISTGRPINKVSPQIDGEIIIDKTKARVAGIISPFSVYGSGFSIRKHRDDPWTLPLFINNGSVNSIFSGFMSLIISHGRAFLTAGPRGSGKTSLLGSLLLELLQRYRLITIEDTQELPIDSYKKLGYDILPLKVRSALADTGMEMPFDKGLRTSLRLGDSALVVGEVRSVEAKILYEAMRVGAMSNVVAGTIHADDPYGVYDRVVNDLGVPKGSFKSTDIIIIQNLIKDPSGIGRKRRVIQVTEVLKDWEEHPKFQDLFVYNPQTDNLEPTDFLLNGKSVTLKNILKRAQGYKDYNSLLNDMYLRSWAKEMHSYIASTKNKSYLEAPFVSLQNNLYVKLVKEHKPFESEQNKKMFCDDYINKLSEGFEKLAQKMKKEDK